MNYSTMGVEKTYGFNFIKKESNRLKITAKKEQQIFVVECEDMVENPMQIELFDYLGNSLFKQIISNAGRNKVAIKYIENAKIAEVHVRDENFCVAI